MQHAGIGAARDDRRVGGRLRAEAQEFVRELGLDLVLVPAHAGALHRAPVRAAEIAAARRISAISCSSLTSRSASSVCRMSTISSGALTPVRARPRTSLRTAVTLRSQALVEPQRRVQRRPVRGEVRQDPVELGDRARLVEAEDLARGVGAETKAVPDLALLVLVAAEQDLPVAVGPGDQRNDRFRFGKAGQVIEIAVVPVREMRVAVAQRLGRGRHERESTARLRAHLLEHRGAAVAVVLVTVVHEDTSGRSRDYRGFVRAASAVARGRLSRCVTIAR